VTTQTALLRATCLEKAGLFDESLPRLQDWELWLRASKQYSFEFMDEPLVITYLQQDSITFNQEALIGAFEMILTKHAKDFQKNKAGLANAYFSIGSHLLHSGSRTSQQRTYLRKAARLNPLKIRFLFYAVVSFLSDKTFNNIRLIYRRTKSWANHAIPRTGPF
jgi:hypothetical protein